MSEIIKELEKLLHRSIPHMEKIDWYKFGVVFNGDDVIELGLYNCGLKTLPESFGELKSLKTLWIYYNKLMTLPESFSGL